PPRGERPLVVLRERLLHQPGDDLHPGGGVDARRRGGGGLPRWRRLRSRARDAVREHRGPPRLLRWTASRGRTTRATCGARWSWRREASAGWSRTRGWAPWWCATGRWWGRAGTRSTAARTRRWRRCAPRESGHAAPRCT